MRPLVTSYKVEPMQGIVKDIFDLDRCWMRGDDNNRWLFAAMGLTIQMHQLDAFKKGKKMVNSIARNAYALTLAVSLGQIRTLIEMPSSMTHSMVPEESKAEGDVDPGGIRLAIGLEDPEDIIRDLRAALSRI